MSFGGFKMIKIFLPDDIIGNREPRLWWLNETRKVPKRKPFMGCCESDYFYTFNDEIHKWCRENKINYSLEFISTSSTNICFEKESDAILFKLTWM